MYNIGDIVKPLKSKKRKTSYWNKGFANKKYTIIDFDKICGEELLVLKVGNSYELVYNDEVVNI